MNTDPLDKVTLVDLEDNIIGQLDKYEAHRHGAQLHRAISVWLVRPTGDSWQVLFQQRSKHKIVGATQWANTICGNVRPTESNQECAHRRLQEELGITQVNIRPLTKFQYTCLANKEYSEREIDQVFIGQYSGLVEPNPLEASQYKWLDTKLVLALPQPIVIEKDNLLQIEKQKLSDIYTGLSRQFTPWTMLMLTLPEIRDFLTITPS